MRSIVPSFSWLAILFFCISIVNLSAQSPTITSFTTAASLATAVGNFSITATPYPSVQQGAKLVGIGAVGIPCQGQSVAVSSYGNTAIVGGFSGNGYAGAAWVYTRSGASRTQRRDGFFNVV